nr:unnamed protein product [Spirometra erinaceieuropaei]
MLITAYRDARTGIRIAYGTDDPLLNQQRMHFQSRVSTTTVHELLFAVDCAPSTISEEDMQGSTYLFSTAYENFCLVTNTRRRWSRVNRHPAQSVPTACCRST